jgi:hypothetical protein
VLISNKYNGDITYAPATNRYPNNVLETEIPNIFDVKWRNKNSDTIYNVKLLDLPGYADY